MSVPIKKNDSPHNAQSILRWAGSKKAIIGKLEGRLPENHTKYIELFSGSACLFFKISPQIATISDSNKDLINFYQEFAANPRGIYNDFISLPRTPEAYYEIRAKIQTESDRQARAAYFLYLNRNCFNGIYRTNSSGHFNVPFSSSRIAGYPELEVFMQAAEVLNNTEIVCGDFEEVCKQHITKGSLVYLDPPYYVPNKRVFKEYSGAPFSEKDFERLSLLLRFIDNKQANFMLSYPDCNLSRVLAKEWNSTRVLVKRIIGGTKSSRQNKYERIITNY